MIEGAVPSSWSFVTDVGIIDEAVYLTAVPSSRDIVMVIYSCRNSLMDAGMINRVVPLIRDVVSSV